MTTYRGLNAGARDNVGTTLALKAATTRLGIVIAERMWKKNKAAALAMMIVANAMSASIVANNYKVIGEMESR